MAPLVVENVTKSFRQGDRQVRALDGVSLEVAEGQFLAIMGASGSGKSTLLHLMAGLTRPDEGRVLIQGTDISRMSDRKLTLFRRRNIGLVFQAFNLICFFFNDPATAEIYTLSLHAALPVRWRP